MIASIPEITPYQDQLIRYHTRKRSLRAPMYFPHEFSSHTPLRVPPIVSYPISRSIVFPKYLGLFPGFQESSIDQSCINTRSRQTREKWDNSHVNRVSIASHHRINTPTHQIGTHKKAPGSCSRSVSISRVLGSCQLFRPKFPAQNSPRW